LASAVDNCRITFIEIDLALQSVKAGSLLKGKVSVSRTFAQRYRWPLRKSRLKDMLDNLDRAKATLALGLHIMQLVGRDAARYV
jgi:hypothetical protein